jgi:hypothetical protein
MKTYRIQRFIGDRKIRDENREIEDIYKELVKRAIRNKALITKYNRNGFELIYPGKERHIVRIFELTEES